MRKGRVPKKMGPRTHNNMNIVKLKNKLSDLDPNNWRNFAKDRRRRLSTCFVREPNGQKVLEIWEGKAKYFHQALNYKRVTNFEDPNFFKEKTQKVQI